MSDVIFRRRCQIKESAAWWHVSRKPLERKLPPRIKVMLRHLTHLWSKVEVQPWLLELPMIQLDRWLKEKTKKTDGQSRRWSKRRSRLDKEPTKKKLKKKESRKKKSMRRSTITLTPCYQGAEARPIVNKKHHYLKSQPRQKQQQLKPSDQHKALGYPERRTESE